MKYLLPKKSPTCIPGTGIGDEYIKMGKKFNKAFQIKVRGFYLAECLEVSERPEKCRGDHSYVGKRQN